MKAVTKFAYWQLRSRAPSPDSGNIHSHQNYVETRLINAIHYDATHSGDEKQDESSIIEEVITLHKQGVDVDDISDMLELPLSIINKYCKRRSKTRCR